MKTKICTKCKKRKKLSEFHKNKSMKDGYHYNCKLCRKTITARKKYLKKLNLLKRGFKECYQCHKVKILSDFYKTSESKDGLDYNCKSCQRKNSKNSRYKKYRVEYRKNHKEEEKKRYIKNRRKRKLYQRELQLKCSYGITLEQYNQLILHQNGKCAICNNKETSKNCNRKIKKLSIDHNHKTGEIRGLLCDNCNNLLGRAKDNINILQNAIKYLKETKKCRKNRL